MEYIGLLLANQIQDIFRVTPFFYKQPIFDSGPKNCLSVVKKPPRRIV